MAPQASKQCGFLPPDHHIDIGSCTSNGVNSEQVPGTFSILTISSLPSQASAQSEKRFQTLRAPHKQVRTFIGLCEKYSAHALENGMYSSSLGTTT